MSKVTLTKTPKTVRGQTKFAKVGEPAPGEYALQIDEDGTATVFGINAAREQLDIQGLASLAATSSDPAILEVDTVSGMSCVYHARGVGKATVTLVAKASDGSFTFTITDPCDVDKNAVRGASIKHGTPTIR